MDTDSCEEPVEVEDTVWLAKCIHSCRLQQFRCSAALFPIPLPRDDAWLSRQKSRADRSLDELQKALQRLGLSAPFAYGSCDAADEVPLVNDN